MSWTLVFLLLVGSSLFCKKRNNFLLYLFKSFHLDSRRFSKESVSKSLDFLEFNSSFVLPCGTQNSNKSPRLFFPKTLFKWQNRWTKPKRSTRDCLTSAFLKFSPFEFRLYFKYNME